MRLWSKDFLELDWSICLIREKKLWTERLTKIVPLVRNSYLCFEGLTKF